MINLVYIGINTNNHFMVGNKMVGIDNDDLIIDGKKCIGNHGLWRLLTSKDAPDEKFYTQDNLTNYSRILLGTELLYKNKDPSTGKPKSSRGDKYMNLIAGIWRPRKDLQVIGVRKYNENPIEYRYVDN